MRPFTRRAEKPLRRRKRRRVRLWLVIPLGCLVLLTALMGINWISFRAIQPPSTPPSNGSLAWERDLGAHLPSTSPATITPVGSAVARFTLPQVLSVADAAEWRGGWILLDRRMGRIHFLDPTLGVTRSWGGRGQGPGELEGPLALAVEDSLLWVLNQRGYVLDRFSLRDGFLDRRRVQGGGCLVGLGERLIHHPEAGLLLLRVCPATLPGPGTAWVEQVGGDGTLTPRLSLPLGTPGSRRIHFLREPALAAGPQGLFLGTWDAPCLAQLGGEWTIEAHRCLPEYDRPQTPREDRSAMERQLERVSELGLLPVEIPSELPWYDAAFMTPKGLVVRRVRGMEERDLVLLDSEGRSFATDELFPEGTFVGGQTILTTRDLLQGTEVQIFRNPWR